MKYKVQLSIKAILFCCLLMTAVASAADSVSKTLYIDGSEVGVTSSNNAISFPFPRLTIGAEGSRYYRYNGLVGLIDEFAVYAGDLNSIDVGEHYSAGPGGYVAAVTADSPILWLRFEDGSSNEGDKAANSGSGVDVNSTYIGTVGLAAGYVGNAAVLGSPDANDCIDVCDWDQQLSLADVSVEFWVKTTQTTDYPRFFQHNGDTAEQGSYGAMYVAETNAVGLIGGGETGYLNAVLNDGEWHHVVVTYNSLQPLSYAAEVLADDPCAYLKLDNLEAVDSSINHYWAGYSRYAKIEAVPGAMGGKAAHLDGSQLIGTPPDLHSDHAVFTWNNVDGTNYREGPGWNERDDKWAFAASDITFEFWFKYDPNITPDYYAFFFNQMGGYVSAEQPNAEPNAPGVGIMGNTPGDSQIRVLGGSEWWYPGVENPMDGVWHHLVVTYDENEVNPGRDMAIQLYLDGDLRGQTTIVDTVGLQAKLGPELNHVVIGGKNDRGWPYNSWSGYIDEFAIYAGVLSGDRVAAHYAAWQPKDCAEAVARGLNNQGDFDGDCDVDLYDFAIFAQGWAGCNDPAGCP